MSMLMLTFGTLLLVASQSGPTTAPLTTIALESFDEQARLPNAAVFFLPGSSALSPVAADIVARAARNAGSGTIFVVQTSSNNEAGEKTAVDRADAVRRELIRNGVPPSAIRVMQAGSSRAGIESRRVVVSVIPAPSNIPGVATVAGRSET
jgi:outer membrane protein OmpA-like peptidoglycan-associated protein